MTAVHPRSPALGLNERAVQPPRINDELPAAPQSSRSSLDALLNQEPPAPHPAIAVSGVNGVERHEKTTIRAPTPPLAPAGEAMRNRDPAITSPHMVQDSRRPQVRRDPEHPGSRASSQAQSQPANAAAREVHKPQQQLPSKPPPLTLAIAPRDLDRDTGMRPAASPAQAATTTSSQTSNARTNSRRQHAPAENGNGIPEHLIRDVSYVPKRRGRPPAAPTNGYERVLSPVAPSPAAVPESNTEALRMALETISRESARAGALQAQLTRALDDVQHLRAKEQAMLTEFEHRVARAVKHHQQKFEATLAAQEARIEELEERLSLAEGGHLKLQHDADSQTIVPDNDSQRTTSLSPMTTEDAAKALLSAKHPHLYKRPMRPASRSASPVQRSPTDSRAPPSRPHSRQSHAGSAIHPAGPHASRFPPGNGAFSSDARLSHSGDSFNSRAHGEKRSADTLDASRDDASSVAGSERSAKRRRTESAVSAVEISPEARRVVSGSSSDAVARMRAHVAGGAPVPEYDLDHIKLIYELDSKGNHVCRVCSMHSKGNQTVGFPVGTPDIDLVLHGMGAHPGLWHSPMATTTPPPRA